MTIAIGCDHAGFACKEQVKSLLHDLGHDVEDFGCYSEESVHYPEYGAKVAQAVSQGKFECGILVCGTGIGMSVVANKFCGVRAALCHDLFTAQACREHNDANILVMGARVLTCDQVKEIVMTYLKTPFAGGRHAQRLELIAMIEAQNMKCRK